MTLHLTRDEADRLTADGRVVLFREGKRQRILKDGNTITANPNIDPPAEFVEAAKPCETCDGRGWYVCPHCGDSCSLDCPDCLDGKRRFAAVGPCDHAADHGDVLDRRRCLTCTGFVTVGHVVVTFGPYKVFHNDCTPAPLVPCVELWDDGVAFLWTATSIQQGVAHRLDLPPDVDPQSLVGQYALGIEAAS